jgi:hypothetical protein
MRTTCQEETLNGLSLSRACQWSINRPLRADSRRYRRTMHFLTGCDQRQCSAVITDR